MLFRSFTGLPIPRRLIRGPHSSQQVLLPANSSQTLVNRKLRTRASTASLAGPASPPLCPGGTILPGLSLFLRQNRDHRYLTLDPTLMDILPGPWASALTWPAPSRPSHTCSSAFWGPHQTPPTATFPPVPSYTWSP